MRRHRPRRDNRPRPVCAIAILGALAGCASGRQSVAVIPGDVRVFENPQPGSPPRETVYVWNRGDRTIAWTAHTEADWIELPTRAGICPPGGMAAIPLFIDAADAPAGRRQGVLRVHSDGLPAARVIVEAVPWPDTALSQSTVRSGAE